MKYPNINRPQLSLTDRKGDIVSTLLTVIALVHLMSVKNQEETSSKSQPVFKSIALCKNTTFESSSL